MMSTTVVAIDGPAGAGKSSVAKAIAVKMGFTHVNTGSLYRAVACALRSAGAALDPVDPAELQKISLEYREGRLLLNGADPGEALRTLKPPPEPVLWQSRALSGNFCCLCSAGAPGISGSLWKAGTSEL